MPGPLPKITEAKIRRWVGSTYAQRGRTYFRNGHVVTIRWRGNVLTGKVQGSEYEPYTVSVKFGRGNNDLEGDCSCPVGYDCKHVAALLYAFLDAPPPGPKGSSVAKALAKLDQPALVALVNAMLVEAPELDELVETHLLAAHVGGASATARDDLALRQEVQQLLQRLEKPGQARAAERALEVLHTKAETLLKTKNWEAAQTMLLVLLGELMLVSETSPSSVVDEVLTQTVKNVLKGWRALPVRHALRHDSLRSLFDFITLEVHQGWGGAYGFSETILRALTQNATSAEREQMQEWIALAMRQPIGSPFDTGEVALDYDDLDVADNYLHSVWAKMRQRFVVKTRTKSKPKSKAKLKTKH